MFEEEGMVNFRCIDSTDSTVRMVSALVLFDSSFPPEHPVRGTSPAVELSVVGRWYVDDRLRKRKRIFMAQS